MWAGRGIGWAAEPLLAPGTYQAAAAPVTLSDLALVSHVRRTHWEPGAGGQLSTFFEPIFVILGLSHPSVSPHLNGKNDRYLVRLC